MAHRVLLRNSAAVLLLAGAATILYLRKKQPDLGATEINAASMALRQHRGILFYNGKPFTGHTFALYSNGDTARLTGYFQGKQEGMMYEWYPGKKLSEERYFSKGEKQGVHRGWWPNGRLKFIYHFKNDEYEGLVTEWFDNGKMYRRFHYHNGHESGNERMWWDNGTIRANYVIVNGEKFGLFGQKLCTNHLTQLQNK